MTMVEEAVAVWLSPDGVPERLVWRGRRFRVTDTPTAFGPAPEEVLGFVTHPPRHGVGWRFQGTSDEPGHETLMFDVLRDDYRQQWRLLRTYA